LRRQFLNSEERHSEFSREEKQYNLTVKLAAAARENDPTKFYKLSIYPFTC
jgi:hypothetical protein